MSCVHAAFHSGVARIELDRPPLNVLDLAAAAELAEVSEDASRREGVSIPLIRRRLAGLIRPPRWENHK